MCDFFFNEEAEISGTLRLGIFAGPPNYGENPESDSHHRYYYIDLDSPIDVLSSELSPVDDEARRQFSYFNNSKIHLIFSDFTPNSPLKEKVGKLIKVTGDFFSQRRGWHQTQVLIRVKQLTII